MLINSRATVRAGRNDFGQLENRLSNTRKDFKTSGSSSAIFEKMGRLFNMVTLLFAVTS